jgi:hypothetical protein
MIFIKEKGVNLEDLMNVNNAVKGIKKLQKLRKEDLNI